MVIMGRRFGLMGLILVASIGINLLFAGMILSSYARMPWERSHGPRFERVIEEIAKSLPPEDASILRLTFAHKRPELEELERQSADLEGRMRDVIRQDPVDPIRIHATASEAQNRQGAFMMLMFNTIADASIGMSPNGRRALSDWHRHRP